MKNVFICFLSAIRLINYKCVESSRETAIAILALEEADRYFLHQCTGLLMSVPRGHCSQEEGLKGAILINS